MKLRIHHILVLPLALAFAACAAPPAAPTVPPPATPAATALSPTAAPAPTAAATIAATAAATVAVPTPTPVVVTGGAALPPDSVRSYRSKGSLTLQTSVANTQPVTQTLTYDSNWKRAGNSSGFDLEVHLTGMETFNQTDNYPSNMSVLMVGDRVYADLGDNHWLSNTRDQAPIDQLPYFFANPEALVPPLADLHKAGVETVGGIETVHYTFDDAGVFDRFNAGQDATATGKLQSTQGDLWIAADGGYLVKMAFSAAVTDKPVKDASGGTASGSQTLDWSYERYDFNAGFDIAAPGTGATPLTLSLPGFDPGTLQIPADSQPKSVSPGMVMIVSQLPPAAVKDFYARQFEALGWQAQGGNPPTWTKDNLRLTLVVNGPAKGPARTAITVETMSK